MKNDLISIIIPVYNVEKYLVRCMESVLNQTYANLEIVLVDDGSPDNCGDICDRYAKIDSRIKVYHKLNGGLSDARNYGVERANGTYITFIDSDDYIASNYIEYLYQLIQKYNSDISVCCMVETKDNHAKYGVNAALPDEQLLAGVQASMALLRDLYMVLVTAWGKLYRSDIVKKYSFPVGKKHEDEATTFKYYYEARTVAVGNHCLYAYFQNPKSITHTIGKKLNTDALWALEHRAKFYEERSENNLAALAWHKLFYFCATDSKENDCRCDYILKNFCSGKTLLKRTKIETRLYNISHGVYWQYDKLRSIGSKIRTEVKSTIKK